MTDQQVSKTLKISSISKVPGSCLLSSDVINGQDEYKFQDYDVAGFQYPYTQRVPSRLQS